MDPKEMLVHQVHQELLVNPELLDHQVQVDPREIQDLKEPKVIQVRLV